MNYYLLVIIGILKLFGFVIVGTALGTIFEYKGWARYISFLIKPILKLGKLPSICGTSLVTAVFSNAAASAMISSAKKDNHITRREMIVTGVSGTFPTHISHLTKALFVLIPLIGPVAIVYYLIIFVCDLIRTFIVLLYNRILSEREVIATEISISRENISWKIILHKTNRRIIHIIKKLMIFYLPLYLLVLCFARTGLFEEINRHIPGFLDKILSPEIVSIAVSKIGGLTSSATVANILLDHSRVLPIQVLLALLIGNMITIPFNTLRRSLPATVAIFPGKDGLWIVLITESIRFIFNLIAILILFILMRTIYA
jgi:hypothetical protein